MDFNQRFLGGFRVTRASRRGGGVRDKWRLVRGRAAPVFRVLGAQSKGCRTRTNCPRASFYPTSKKAAPFKFDKKQIAKREKLTTSMMPGGLNQALTQDDLVNLVEYLFSLKTVK